MKIYCSRIPKDYEGALRWLVGKDIWVRVYDKSHSKGYAWYRFVEVNEYKNKLWCEVNRIPPNFFALNIAPEIKEHQLTRVLYVTDKDFLLVQPIDTLTTDELRHLEDT